MDDQYSGSMGERMAKLEGMSAECLRQLEAMWKRSDEHERHIAELKIEHVQTTAKLESEIAHLDRENMRETLTMRNQIAEIGWRVGIVAGTALLVLNFVLNKIDFSELFRKTEVKVSSRR